MTAVISPAPTAPSARFASDNVAGIHPAILQAVLAANVGPALAYGHDAASAAAAELVCAHFGAQCAVFFVLNGTGANVVSLQALVRSYHAVFCADCSHLYNDECGAPERFAGCKLLPVPTTHGKITVAALNAGYSGDTSEHFVQPRVLALTNATECGTVYTPAEVSELAEWAHARGLWVHMDGARLANAAASLNVSLRALTSDVGVDIVSFGGTKNGLLAGEAVVVCTPALAEGLLYWRKQSLQLASKMRFIAAQFSALLSDELWLKNATHANHMAQRLSTAAQTIPGVELTHPTQANAVFARLSPTALATLQRTYYFYEWTPALHEVRWMTAFDTTEADVDAFVAALRASV